jgi:YHS domain-containing protein
MENEYVERTIDDIVENGKKNDKIRFSGVITSIASHTSNGEGEMYDGSAYYPASVHSYNAFIQNPETKKKVILIKTAVQLDVTNKHCYFKERPYLINSVNDTLLEELLLKESSKNNEPIEISGVFYGTVQNNIPMIYVDRVTYNSCNTPE